jgi:hypothetical protein
MNVAVLAFGSRGDAQPAVALAGALAARGHSTRLVAPVNFAPLASGRGAEFHPLPFDMLKLIHEPEAQALFSDGGGSIGFLRWLNEIGRKCNGALAPAALEGATGAPQRARPDQPQKLMSKYAPAILPTVVMAAWTGRRQMPRATRKTPSQ